MDRQYLRTLDDTALVNYTEPLSPDWSDDTDYCADCGAVIEFGQNRGTRKYCDSCASERNRNRGLVTNPILPQWQDRCLVLCVKSSEYYTMGNRYQRLLVYEDIFNALVSYADFEGVTWQHVKTYFSKGFIHKHAAWKQDNGFANVGA